MKKLFLIGLFFLISINSFAQQRNDTHLLTYLKNKGFVALADTVHLPKSILAYYPAIMKYLSGEKSYMKDFYVFLPFFTDGPFLNIPLWDISGIKELKQLHDAISPPKDTIVGGEKMTMVHMNTIGGNMSGRDGNLKINKNTGEITFNLDQ